MKKLIIRLNNEKETLKKEGIHVDGKHYKITFKGWNCFSHPFFNQMPT